MEVCGRVVVSNEEEMRLVVGEEEKIIGMVENKGEMGKFGERTDYGGFSSGGISLSRRVGCIG